MSDQDNLFNKETTSSTSTTEEVKPNESNTDSVADLLAGITNEDGNQKYSSVEKALESLAPSQQHIKRLEAEAKEREAEINALRETAIKVSTLEETISKMAATPPADQTEPTPAPSSSLNEEAVMDLVSKALQQRELKSVAETNTNKVQTTLIAQYGDKAQEVIVEKAKQLNTTPQALGELASTSPDMVLALFNSGNAPTTSPSTGSVNIPLVKPEHPPLEKPTQSLLAGATSAEQTAYMQKIKEDVYRRFNVET